jgi:hypothetical protein
MSHVVSGLGHLSAGDFSIYFPRMPVFATILVIEVCLLFQTKNPFKLRRKRRR